MAEISDKLILELCPYERPDIAPYCIYLVAPNHTIRKFLDWLLYCTNEAGEPFEISSQGFVDNKLKKQLWIEIDNNHHSTGPKYGYILESAERYTWYLRYDEVGMLALGLHGLEYAWSHLHCDPEPGQSTIAVEFCSSDWTF